ncbi:uncharacterized protein LOC129591028 [Paramacrobiotus metropolitanus]|uniref:uncharacterized protein LOC129591028 n=1 Tax=Paramacrobiotus metropolitanus TaxID=2943436 RepID=UPI0024460A1D|nr:uncharacterized protein LOC129591028 [Paramacrobiotus metropolitanus]XP_055342490.1 uncharacterized protein LOC129591028 [Paramacrobiotus metropolitanus]
MARIYGGAIIGYLTFGALMLVNAVHASADTGLQSRHPAVYARNVTFREGRDRMPATSGVHQPSVSSRYSGGPRRSAIFNSSAQMHPRSARMTIDWEDTMRSILLQGISGLSKAGGVPEVGLLMGAIVSYFWPKNKPNVWLQVRQQVDSLIDSKIEKFEEFTRIADLDGLRLRMDSYRSCVNLPEKGDWLVGILGRCLDIYSYLDNSPNKNQTFVYAVNLAYVHMAALRERYMFGEQLFPGQVAKEQWYQEMENWLARYWTFLSTAFSNWMDWRWRQVELEEWRSWGPMLLPPFFRPEDHMTVRDKLTNTLLTEKNCVMCSGKSSDYHTLGETIRRAYVHRQQLAMMTVISKAFILHNFVKGYEDLGPFAGDFPLLHSGIIQPPTYVIPTTGTEMIKCQPAMADWGKKHITSVLVRSHNWIDGMQITYENGADTFAGKENGGTPHTLSFNPRTNQCLSSVHWRFSKVFDTIVSVRFKKAVGTESEEFGNKQDLANLDLETSAPPLFCIMQISLCAYPHPFAVTGFQVIYGMPNDHRHPAPLSQWTGPQRCAALLAAKHNRLPQELFNHVIKYCKFNHITSCFSAVLLISTTYLCNGTICIRPKVSSLWFNSFLY